MEKLVTSLSNSNTKLIALLGSINFGIKEGGVMRKFQLNELEEICNDAYYRAKYYKAKLKVNHDQSTLQRKLE